MPMPHAPCNALTSGKDRVAQHAAHAKRCYPRTSRATVVPCLAVMVVVVVVVVDSLCQLQACFSNYPQQSLARTSISPILHRCQPTTAPDFGTLALGLA